MVASIIVTVRSDLMDALKPVVNATAGMERVYTGFQAPVGDNLKREVVWTRNASIDLSSASLRAGRNFNNETTSFEVVVWTWRPNSTAEAAAQRAVDIAEVACAWIADHKNGEGLTNAKSKGLTEITISGNGSQDESLSNDSIAGHFVIPITYKARLT